MTRYESRFRKVARTLGPLELMRSSIEAPLEDATLFDRDVDRRFLDYYGDEGLRLALEKYGLIPALARRGYPQLELHTHVSDERHTLLVHGRASDDEEWARIIELVVRRDRMTLAPALLDDARSEPPLRDAYEVLTVDWLLLQHVRGTFSPERPRLPGQSFPGLGVGERVLELLYRVAARLDLAALVTVAEYLHNAELYARELPFFDPVQAGRFAAIVDVLRGVHGLSLAQASWAVEWGCVRGPDDAVLRWRGEAQLRAFEPSLCAYLESEEHAARIAAERASFRVTLDRALFDDMWSRERESLER